MNLNDDEKILRFAQNDNRSNALQHPPFPFLMRYVRM